MKVFTLTVLLAFLVETAHSQIVINEICASNGDINYDPDFFNFSGWVELHNKSNASVSIGGYYLSNDPANLTKWRVPSGISVPANGYRLIWCDERATGVHTNFKIDSDGETLILSNAGQTEIDRVTYPAQFLNVSWARTSVSSTSWSHNATPTPNAVNSANVATVQLAKPVVSLAAGRYSGRQSISISHPISEVSIRYTLDGTEPNASSSLYTASVSVTATATLKAKAFLQGYIPSEAEVRTYFISEHNFTLPVVSLSMNPAYLNDNTIGIYVTGTNGLSGVNCTENKVNWNQDWERHAVFEYFDKSGSKLLDHGVDIRIGGACSRNNPQKSLVIRARDKYGRKTIEHSFFETKSDVTKVGGLFLRNSGNDFYYTMFRDALMHSLIIGQMDVDYLAYQPSIVYLNGKYWGIQNLREKIDADYIEANYGVKKNDVDIIETGGRVIEGTIQQYSTYLDSLQRIDLSSDEAFKFMSRYIDVQEFINYLTAEIYYANTDWPGNNVKFWRQRSTNGKFRWVLWDTDFGFALYTDRSFATHPTLNFATEANGPGWPNPPWSTLHLRLLLQNDQFRNRFAQTLTTSLSTTFQPERVINMINSFQGRLAEEMPRHTARWNRSMSSWNWEVERLRIFARERNEYMKAHIADFFGLNEQVRITTECYPETAGTITLNGINTGSSADNISFFKGLPYNASAVATPGYAFSKFEITLRETMPVALVSRNANWHYYDLGTLPSESWKELDYDDGAWKQGEAELGYGDGDEKTVVGFGGNPSNKFITTYFRKQFTVADTTGMEALTGRVLYDDGVVVYLNGEEVYRGNMPAGAITNTTLAIQAIPNETTFFSFIVPRGKVRPGSNVIAVEIHQSDPSSSDISFNFELASYLAGEVTHTTSLNPDIDGLVASDVMIKAFFEPVVAVEGLVINEFTTRNSSYPDEFGDNDDWIELYNKGDQAINIAGFYFTDNLNQKRKHQIKKGKHSETIILPGEYKIVWADAEPVQGPLHLNFRLSSTGEDLAIYQPVGSTLVKVEEFRFGPQQPGTSFSRIPDVTGPFLETGKPTPLGPNEMEVPTSTSDQQETADISLYPNPASSVITIEGGIAIDEVRIYNSQGKLVHTMLLKSGQKTLHLPPLSSGLYSFVCRSSTGSVTKRVVIE